MSSYVTRFAGFLLTGCANRRLYWSTMRLIASLSSSTLWKLEFLRSLRLSMPKKMSVLFTRSVPGREDESYPVRLVGEELLPGRHALQYSLLALLTEIALVADEPRDDSHGGLRLVRYEVVHREHPLGPGARCRGGIRGTRRSRTRSSSCAGRGRGRCRRRHPSPGQPRHRVSGLNPFPRLL